MDNKSKSFTTILFFSEGMAPEYGVCYHDLKKEIKILGKHF